MIIKTKKYNSNQTTYAYLDHFMYSILAFLATFWLIFQAVIDSDTKHNSNKFTNLIENEAQYLLLCLAGTVILNIIYYFRNKDKQFTYSLSFSDSQQFLELENRKKYSNEKIIKRVNYQDMTFRYEKKHNKYYNKLVKQIAILDKNNEVSLIAQYDYVWDKHPKEFNLINRKLKDIELNNQRKLTK